MLAHREQPIPSLRDVRPDVSEALESVFAKMVAKSADDRFQSTEELISALQACQGDLGTAAPPPPKKSSKPPVRSAGAASKQDTGSIADGATAMFSKPKPQPKSKAGLTIALVVVLVILCAPLAVVLLGLAAIASFWFGAASDPVVDHSHDPIPATVQPADSIYADPGTAENTSTALPELVAESDSLDPDNPSIDDSPQRPRRQSEQPCRVRGPRPDFATNPPDPPASNAEETEPEDDTRLPLVDTTGESDETVANNPRTSTPDAANDEASHETTPKPSGPKFQVLISSKGLRLDLLERTLDSAHKRIKACADAVGKQGAAARLAEDFSAQFTVEGKEFEMDEPQQALAYVESLQAADRAGESLADVEIPTAEAPQGRLPKNLTRLLPKNGLADPEAMDFMYDRMQQQLTQFLQADGRIPNKAEADQIFQSTLKEAKDRQLVPEDFDPAFGAGGLIGGGGGGAFGGGGFGGGANRGGGGFGGGGNR
mgnify:CR=1 FL=1